jgi:hypothetical protein
MDEYNIIHDRTSAGEHPMANNGNNTNLYTAKAYSGGQGEYAYVRDDTYNPVINIPEIMDTPATAGEIAAVPVTTEPNAPAAPVAGRNGIAAVPVARAFAAPTPAVVPAPAVAKVPDIIEYLASGEVRTVNDPTSAGYVFNEAASNYGDISVY